MKKLFKVLLAVMLVTGCFQSNAMWRRGAQAGARAAKQTGFAQRTWGSLKNWFTPGWRRIRVGYRGEKNITAKDVERALSSAKTKSGLYKHKFFKSGIYKGKSRIRTGKDGRQIVEMQIPSKFTRAKKRFFGPTWRTAFFGESAKGAQQTKEALKKAGTKYRIREGYIDPRLLIESKGPSRFRQKVGNWWYGSGK